MQTPKIINAFFILSIFCFVLNSCETTITEPKYIPNLDGINEVVDLIRFEQDFFAIDTLNIRTELDKLKEKYPEFTMGFLATVIGVRDSASEKTFVQGYLNHEDALYTYDTVQQVYKEMKDVQKELNELASYYTYYFPNSKPLTKAFTYLSEYHGDRMAVLEDGFLGLPLDMALGEGYPAYTFLKIPAYDQRTCNREHLVAKAADAISQNLIVQLTKTSGNHLIDLMIFNGKQMYLTDILLPTVVDSLKFSFSALQMEYCTKGELELYEHLSNEELFYSSETKLISKYITKGPFKPHLDLPGNSGSWLGYRMILSYAKQQRQNLKMTNPNWSERELNQQVLKLIMKELDPQKFLELYKPPKR